jgi:hypothetical protein
VSVLRDSIVSFGLSQNRGIFPLNEDDGINMDVCRKMEDKMLFRIVKKNVR